MNFFIPHVINKTYTRQADGEYFVRQHKYKRKKQYEDADICFRASFAFLLSYCHNCQSMNNQSQDTDEV